MLQQSREAKRWRVVNASNPPSIRWLHTAVVDAQQRMWIFGGPGGRQGVCACSRAEDSCSVTRRMVKNQCSRKIRALVIADCCNLVFRIAALFRHPGHAFGP